MAPHSSTLAWKIPWTEEPDWLQSMGSLRVGHRWATSLSLFTFIHWRRKWQPTPVFLLGESQGRESLVGCTRVYGVAQSRTWLKRLSSSSSSFVVSFDIGKCESSNFIPLYQYCLGYSGSLVIPYEPEDRLLVLEKKKNCWNFDRDFIELVNQLGSIAILTIVNLLPH